jgi:hypothetical protein
MPFTLLTTKLHIPAPRPDVVPRPLLIARLNEALRCPGTLISAFAEIPRNDHHSRSYTIFGPDLFTAPDNRATGDQIFIRWHPFITATV